MPSNNRKQEYYLRQDRNKKYCKELENVLIKESKLLTQMLESSNTSSVDDCSNHQLRLRYMHMRGYIRFLQKKIHNTSD